MLKALIVDDEPMIREGLQTLIEWGKFGFEIAGTAASGKEAVEKHAELRPDLILIDIRMPVMDGLQAIEAIRAVDKTCQILILSGYADFNYAKQAIVHGVGGYVLKPIDEDELESCVERAAKLLRKSGAGELTGEEADLYRDVFLQRLCEGKLEEEDWEEDKLERMFGRRPTNCRLLLVELYSREHSLTMKGVVKKRLSELAAGYEAGWLFVTEPYIGMLLNDIPLLRGDLEPLTDWLGEACGGRIRFTGVVSRPAKELRELQDEVAGMKDMLKRRFMLEGGQIYAVEQWQEEQAEAGIEERTSIEELAQKLFYMVDIGSRDGVVDALREAAELLPHSAPTEQQLKSAWAQLLTIVLNKAAAAHPQLSLRDDLTMVTSLYLAHHYDEMLIGVEGRLLDLADKIGYSDSASVMKRITDFIDRHYFESLKLETIAELFNYNSGYLGKLFKSHTGESFNTYLDKVRINCAIELLQQGHKVHQVAQRVGYANVDYFHSKFKKYKGVSPSAYKSSGEK